MIPVYCTVILYFHMRYQVENLIFIIPPPSLLLQLITVITPLLPMTSQIRQHQAALEVAVSLVTSMAGAGVTAIRRSPEHGSLPVYV